MVLICAGILTVLGCKTGRHLAAQLPPVPPIDSIGTPVIHRQIDSSYQVGADTLIQIQGVQLPDYVHAGGSVMVIGGILSVRVPRPAQLQIRETQTVQLPVYKENLSRVSVLMAMADELQRLLDKTKAQLNNQTDAHRQQLARKQQEIDKLNRYKNIVLWAKWIGIGLILGAVIWKVADWKFGGILGLIGRIFKR